MPIEEYRVNDLERAVQGLRSEVETLQEELRRLTRRIMDLEGGGRLY